MSKPRVDWVNLEDEENERAKEVRVESKKMTRTREIEENNVKKRVAETVVVNKLLLPVRRVVKQRKEMKKFGEVAHVPKGQHQDGDIIQAETIYIETPDSLKADIGIVNQVMNITTEKLKEKREIDRLEKLTEEINDQPANGAPNTNDEFRVVGDRRKRPVTTTQPVEKGKWDALFGNRQPYSVKIQNFIPHSDEADLQQEEEDSFKDFIRDNLKDIISRINKEFRIRCSRNKKTNKLTGIVFMTFPDEDTARQAYQRLQGLDYNSAILDIQEPRIYEQR